MSKLLQKRQNKSIRKIKPHRELEWLDFDDDDFNESDYDSDTNDEAVYEYEDSDVGDEAYEETDYDEDAYEDEEYDEEYDDDYDEDDDEYEEYDDDDIEDYDDIYDDDDDEEADEVVEGFGKVLHFLTRMSMADYMLIFTGILVLVLVGVTGTMFVKGKMEDKQVAAFAEIGAGLENIPIIGESGLLAVADAQAAKAAAAEIEEPQQEEEQVEDESEKIEVSMNLTSIQKDLKIKFINKKSGKLIPNVAFEVEVNAPSDKKYTLVDEDKDGIIYEKDIAPGEYRLLIVGPEDAEKYSFPKEAVKTKVKDTIEYKKVDVSDEIKTEDQVDVSAEDTKVNDTEIESANKDTVEWVESTKTLIEGTQEVIVSYEKVNKSDITDPSAKAALDFRMSGIVKASEEEGTPVPVPTESEEPKETEIPKETQTPTETQTPAETEVPKETQSPTGTEKPKETEKPTETPESTPGKVPEESPSDEPDATQTPEQVPEEDASESPSASPTVSPTKKPKETPTATPNSAQNDTKSNLKSNSGDQLYVKKDDGSYRKAKYADYFKKNIEFYKKVETTTGQYRYTGWQTIDGATYFFDKNGNKVTGEQVIQGAKYTFNENGVLNTGSGQLGIDVSKWNGAIDWNAVKNSGVSYVIIRCGYRGSTTGALIEDPMFRTNIKGAQNAGLKVGIYFFTQAMNEVEAVQEASMVLGLIKGYSISYPVFLDVEASGGRADAISPATRTAVCKAFCQTIQNSGYRAGIYANKTWFTTHMDTPSLTGYKIWLAQYAAAPTYTRTKYDLWQYSSKGRVAGINGNVDMNISYLGY